MNKLSYFLVFAVGAISGSAATYHFVKKKFEAISNEEIRSVKESFKKDIMNPVADLLNIVANVKKKMMIEIINLNIILDQILKTL